jgi:hypothetical protein
VTEFSYVRMDSTQNISHRLQLNLIARLSFPLKTGSQYKHLAKYTTEWQCCPFHAMKVYGGRTGIAPFVFYFDTRQGGRQSRSRHFGEEDNLLAVTGIVTRIVR